MKGKIITIWISIVLLLVAGGILLASYCIQDCSLVNILNGFGFGILGSAIVTGAISIGEYHTEKEATLVRYYAEAIRVLDKFLNIQYCACDEESDLVVAFCMEQYTNRVWGSLIGNNTKDKNEAKESLIEYYTNVWRIIEKDYSEQKKDVTISVREETVLRKMEESINSYRHVAMNSLKALENAYSQMDFFTCCGNKKYKDWIYKEIQKPICEAMQIIHNRRNDFDIYSKGELKDNLCNAYSGLKEITEIFFEEIESNNEERSNGIKAIKAKVATDLNNKLQELRGKIYKEEYEEDAPIVVKIFRADLFKK